jgi:hypothetical protein
MPINMRRFLPAKFQLRERILFGLAVVLACVGFYFSSTANPRASTGIWIGFMFVGTILFVAIGGSDRAFFTAVYCVLLSGAQFILDVLNSVFFGHRPRHLSDWLVVLCINLFLISILVTFAWAVTCLIHFLEKIFHK